MPLELENQVEALQPAQVTAIDSPQRRTTFRVLVALLLLEPLVVLGVLVAVGVPWWLVLCLCVIAGAVLAGVLWGIAMVLWKPWERRYPAQGLRAGAVSQSWQSFGLGRFGRLSNCLTIIADERHLHLSPFAPLRWLGCGVISLPLDRVLDVRPGLLPRSELTAEIDGHAISGPAWALALARQEPQHQGQLLPR
jgi:hypothetical protein